MATKVVCRGYVYIDERYWQLNKWWCGSRKKGIEQILVYGRGLSDREIWNGKINPEHLPNPL